MVTRRTSARKKRASRLSLAGVSAGSSRSSRFGGAQPARRGGIWVALVLAGLVLVNLYVFVWDKKTSVGAVKKEAEAKSAVIPGAALAGSGSAATAIVTAPAPVLPVVTAPVGPPATIDGKVGKGDSLGRLLKHAGLTGAEADEVIRALSGVMDFRAIRAGEAFKIERGPDGRVKRFELDVSKSQHVHAARDATGALVGASQS
jgi:hypothetical protein